MKNIILGLMLVTSPFAGAHEILGTQVLEGSLKTKIMVNGVETTCKAKISKVKNLMEQDSYGNPAYKILVNIDLSGNDYERDIKVKYGKRSWMNNLFKVGNKTEVRDFDYFAEDGSTLKINGQGRLVSTSVIYNNKTVTCTF